MWWFLVALFVYLWATITVYLIISMMDPDGGPVWALFLWPIFPILALWELVE